MSRSTWFDGPQRPVGGTVHVRPAALRSQTVAERIAHVWAEMGDRDRADVQQSHLELAQRLDELVAAHDG